MMNNVLSNKLNGYSFGDTADGKPGYRKPGADTVTPFNSFSESKVHVITGANQITDAQVGSRYLLYCQTFYNPQNVQISLSGAVVDTVIKPQDGLWGQYSSNYCAVIKATNSTVQINAWSTDYIGAVLVEI